MNGEKRKAYNEKYYKENRETIIKKLCKKVECPFCSRLVIHNHLEKHKQTSLCKRYAERKINDVNRISDIQQRIKTFPANNKIEIVEDLPSPTNVSLSNE